MDRTAWIVVALCVVGLLLWEFYFAKQMAPRPAPVTAASGHALPTPSLAVRVPSPSPLATPEAVPQGVETAPTFTEKVEALRNSDVELRLTKKTILLSIWMSMCLIQAHSRTRMLIISSRSARRLRFIRGTTRTIREWSGA